MQSIPWTTSDSRVNHHNHIVKYCCKIIQPFLNSLPPTYFHTTTHFQESSISWPLHQPPPFSRPPSLLLQLGCSRPPPLSQPRTCSARLAHLSAPLSLNPLNSPLPPTPENHSHAKARVIQQIQDPVSDSSHQLILCIHFWSFKSSPYFPSFIGYINFFWGGFQQKFKNWMCMRSTSATVAALLTYDWAKKLSIPLAISCLSVTRCTFSYKNTLISENYYCYSASPPTDL